MAEIDDIGLKISKRVQTYLFRIAQEGLNNIVKHAAAGEVSLNLYQERGSLVLSIEDNGKGFVLDMIGKTKGQGLENMIQRTSLINGKIDINSVPGKGTIITVSVPANCKMKNG
jgi:signal transduction histidine kinase